MGVRATATPSCPSRATPRSSPPSTAIYESQKTGGFAMVAIVPNDTIRWDCSGDMSRAAELRAMCESVKYKKD